MFEKLLGWVAWIVLIYSIVCLISGFGFAFYDNLEGFQRYFPNKTTGQIIDRALIGIVAGLLLGTVAKIARRQ